MSQTNKSNNKVKLALLISGSGTTMEAIIKATRDGRLPNVEPALIIASDPLAGGIAKAHALHIKEQDILVMHPKDFKTRKEFGEKIIEECKSREVDIIGQYGWMIKTPENVINVYEGRIINQHPGPLDTGRPDFGGAGMFGLRVHQARLEFIKKADSEFWTEATAHLVTKEFDQGVIIKRRQVPTLKYDTAETLSRRVLPVEHEVQIEALKDLSSGNVEIFQRETPLVFPGEEELLEECKEIAKKMYPNG